MFYAPDILSYKNKTELSLVYYLSTTKNPKNAVKKEIVNLNFGSIIDQMKNPKIPFALRLYSYLIKGLVQIWIIKIDFYKVKINSLFLEHNIKKGKSIRRPTLNENINLRIADHFINDNNLEINSFLDRNNELSQLNKIVNADAFDFDGIIESVNSLQDMKSSKKRYIKIDNKVEMKLDEIWIKNTRPSFDHLPGLDSCFIISLFEDRISKYNNNDFDVDLGYDNVSVEDPRVSSTNTSISTTISSQIVKDHDLSNKNPSMWFYNLLVEASAGRVILKQNEPFGVIEIEYLNN